MKAMSEDQIFEGVSRSVAEKRFNKNNASDTRQEWHHEIGDIVARRVLEPIVSSWRLHALCE